jgi:glycosyltransferase involved in cell wall biosynthesis
MNPISVRPRVSGIMAARNTAAYVGAAIESALGQTYANFELLVVDDASTDGTAEIIAGHAEGDARVRLFRQAEWSGPAAARNLALREARGEWIAVLDSDDLWRPDRLKLQLAVVDANPSVRLVTSEYQGMDVAGRPLEIVPCAGPEWWLLWRLLFENVLGGHSQVLFRREPALACGGYRSDFEAAEDYKLWVNLASEGGVACVHEVLMDYRMHDKSASALNPQLQRMQAGRISDEALSVLLGESWPPERLACLRDFWLGPFPAGEGSLPQLARDLRHLEHVFWRRHPESATLANRLVLEARIRRQWARYAFRLLKSGCGRASVSAWRYAVV